MDGDDNSKDSNGKGDKREDNEEDNQIRGKIMRKIIRLIIINCMKIMKINIPTIINIIIISTRQK